MEKKRTPIPPRHTAYPRRPPEPKTAEARPAAVEERNGHWTRTVPEGRRFPRT